MKLIALMGGDDWYDASVDLMAIPDDLDLKAEEIAYLEWRNEWQKNVNYNTYISFPNWLKKKGSRDALPTEIVAIWEP